MMTFQTCHVLDGFDSFDSGNTGMIAALYSTIFCVLYVSHAFLLQFFVFQNEAN